MQPNSDHRLQAANEATDRLRLGFVCAGDLAGSVVGVGGLEAEQTKTPTAQP